MGYNPYRPYGMVPKGTTVSVHLEDKKPEVSPETEKTVEVQEEKPKTRKRRPPKNRTPFRRRSQ